jgi:hypothetical protein
MLISDIFWYKVVVEIYDRVCYGELVIGCMVIKREIETMIIATIRNRYL